VERYTGVRRLLVSGGGLPGPVSRDIFARVLKREIVEIENRDTSLAGAAMLAWRGVDRFDSLETAVAHMPETAEGSAQEARQPDEYDEIYERYCAVVEKARGAFCSTGKETASGE